MLLREAGGVERGCGGGRLGDVVGELLEDEGAALEHLAELLRVEREHRAQLLLLLRRERLPLPAAAAREACAMGSWEGGRGGGRALVWSFLTRRVSTAGNLPTSTPLMMPTASWNLRPRVPARQRSAPPGRRRGWGAGLGGERGWGGELTA